MLGLVSLFMDMSSEMAHAVLPLFVVGTLGASVAVLGFLEALAGAFTHFSKLYSGLISDRFENRKGLALLGYGLAALSKPFFPLAQAPWMVFAARISDRIGKGIRGAPRDALVADITTPEQRGAAYGLRQSMDSFGAFAGPLIAVALVGLYAFDVRGLLWVACLPALVCVGVLALGVEEPARHTAQKKPRADLSMATARALGGPFWRVMAVAAALLVARISDAFLVLRASELGLSLMFIPLVLVVMNGVDTLTSYPSGWLSDHVGRKLPLLLSLVALAASMGVLAFGATLPLLWLGLGLFGLHMALSQSVLSSLVADAAPKDLRGSAFGMLGLVSGLATFATSLLAGLAWDKWGAATVFAAAAAVAVLALLAGLMIKAPAKA
ncbi:MAG: MFS transporter [Alphaproteobacteria bacterium]|nr:MFS transporter [Alphaproteobacteria bacterium]